MNPELSPRQKQLVRDSFESIQEFSDSVVLLFYGRLFELAPQVRGMFKIGIREQARKLMDMLSAIVETLDHFDELRPKLVDLGRRHVAYGVEPAHYEVLATALLWAFGQALGAEFDRETRTSWQGLLEAISTVMLEATAAE